LIVVARIVAFRSPGDEGGQRLYEIEVLSVMKGDAKPGAHIVAILRNLPFDPSRGDPKRYRRSVLDQWIVPGDRRALFLMKIADKKRGADYQAYNAGGDSFWVSPDSDLSKIGKGDVRKSITSLLDDVVAYETARLEDLKARVKNSQTDP
jgi:hypothetical protein